MRIKRNFLFSLGASALLWACQAQRVQHEITPPLPEAYRTEQQVNRDSSMANIQWRDFFTDAVLRDLIDTALANNVDMQLALKNMEAAELEFKRAKAGLLPNLQLQIQANTTNPSNNSLNGVSLSQFLGQNHIEDYNAALGLSWEADIWGKIKNQKAAARAIYLQTAEAQHAIQTQLVNQVAKAYYRLLMLYDAQEIAARSLTLSENSLTLAQYQYEVGDISLLAIEQLAAQKLAAASLIPDFKQQIALQENALRILSGQLPARIDTKSKLRDVALPAMVNVGIPIQLLSKRPDIKQRELAIRAAAANEQAARAHMYPSLVISAQAGVNALTASNWFTIPASLFGSLTGGLTQPILQKRQLRTQYELAQVDYEKSVILFRQAVLNATGEVSDALISIAHLAERENVLLERTNRLQNAIKNADLLFETGSANYLDVVAAQSNALQSELELVQIRQSELAAAVDLYRSLGGGWQ
ncbi:TolC family protein [Sphingobacterium oryzagri]|uniref:TolC family protein n=1 Tax=Sphingobacterium oryzagri TaxID=3025669 RepID=A0ABY7WNM7_9SPHI|nr:TolC family protein [Sphingobacterium sp. KACC 22765]WDF70302.1 TolC family protein [Sphingobacterium sp. KACC 22765]